MIVFKQPNNNISNQNTLTFVCLLRAIGDEKVQKTKKSFRKMHTYNVPGTIRFFFLIPIQFLKLF